MGINILEILKSLVSSNGGVIGERLALIYEKLRINNPLVYLILMGLSVGVLWAGENCMFEICSNDWIKIALEILGLAIIGFTKPATWVQAQKAKGNTVEILEEGDTVVTKVTKKSN